MFYKLGNNYCDFGTVTVVCSYYFAVIGYLVHDNNMIDYCSII